MKPQQSDIVEDVAKWLNQCGFEEDLSALTAGLHDIHAAMEKINNKLLPSLLQLSASQKDEALDIIIAWWLEMGHISRHAVSTEDVLTEVRDFLDES